MKKIISLIVACLMLITACPVLADATTTASIVSVENGAEFTVGSVIPLMVETNESQIERIDFYANGIKIPGTATDASKSVVWTPQVAGDYALTAVVTGKTEGTTSAAAVNVRINAADEEMVFTFDSEDSLSTVTGNGVSIDNIYTKKSNYSAKWSPNKDRFVNFTALAGDRIGDTYINYLIYSTKPITLYSTLTCDSTEMTRPTNYNYGWFTLKEGWNTVSSEIAKKTADGTAYALDGYCAPEERIPVINEILFQAGNQTVKIPTGYGFANAGELLYSQTGIEEVELYFDSAWLSKTQASAAAPTATTVLNGKTDVCNALDKMTINFSKEMDTATLVKGNVTVTSATNGAFEDFTCTASSDAMVIDFTNNLAYDDTYTVSINENVTDAYGLSVSGDKEWSFTTIQSCNNADPIVELTYPKNDATLTSNNVVVAANVTFDGNVDKVEFYKSNDTLLGTGTKGADGEYYCEVADLTEGAYSVYAKVSFNTESTLSPKTTSAVSFTVADTINYTLTGLKNGEEIVLNTTINPVISRTVGISDTTGVSKVVYKVDGVEKATVASTPFTWDMPITSIDNAQSVSADVYTAGGKVATPAVSYSAIYVYEEERRKTYSSNFDETVVGTDVAKTDAGISDLKVRTGPKYKVSYEDVTSIGGTGNAVKIANIQTTIDQTCLLWTKEVNITDGSGVNSRAAFAFDLYLPNTGSEKSVIAVRPTNGKADENKVYLEICKLNTLESGKWHKIKVYLDMESKTITTIINETATVETISDEIVTQFLAAAAASNKVYIRFDSWGDLYIDNFYQYRVLDKDLDGYSFREDSFVNGVNYITDAAGVDATVTVANRSASAVNPAVLFALYNSDMKLVKAWVENTAVQASELKHINKYVAYNQGGETGSIVKAFCWNSMNELVPVDSIR